MNRLYLKISTQVNVLVSLFLTLNMFHTFVYVSFVDFEQVNVRWVDIGTHISQIFRIFSYLLICQREILNSTISKKI